MRLPLLLRLALVGFGSLAAASAQTSLPSPSPAPALDFGNFSSETLTTKAWRASDAGDLASAAGYADKCIEMFGDKAVEQQKALAVPLTVKEDIFTQWALNDVGTCYFIRGQILEKQGKGKEAVTAYKFLFENLPFAQTWDTKGWFWKPADAAAGRVKALEFDAL